MRLRSDGLSILAFFCGLTYSSLAASAGPSNEWSQGWAPTSSADRTSQLMQADLIAKREAGYYTNIGSVNYYSTSTIGTVSTTNITVTGDSNTVAASNTSSNNGTLNGSINTGSQNNVSGNLYNGNYTTSP